MTALRVDLHIDTLSLLAERGGGLTPKREDFHVDAERCQAGGISLLGTAVFTVDGHEEPWKHCLSLFDARDRLHSDPNEPFQIVTHPDQLADLPAGTSGMLTTIENGIALEGEVSRLDFLHDRGVRILGLVWNGANELGQGCLEDSGEGLTSLGKEMVREAMSLGWAIDISHLNRRGVLDLCDMGAIVIATHSNARQIHDHVRNIDDEILQVLASCPAVVGINAFPPFLGPEASLETFDRHVSHVESMIGVNRVCLGTDLDGVSRTMSGFRDYRDMGRLWDELSKVNPHRADGVLGENFMNFWKTWAR